MQSRLTKAIVTATTLSIGSLFPIASWAADVTLSVTGAPTSVMQGQTVNFTINASTAAGNLPATHSPANVRVYTAYTAASGGGSTYDLLVYQNKGYTRAGQNNTSGGPYAIQASLTVPSGLTPGPYTATIHATSTQGIGLNTAMPSFAFEVRAASVAPIVTINTPASNGYYKVNETIQVSVDVTSQTPLYSVVASLNGGPEFALTCTPDAVEPTEYECGALLLLTQPGSNTLSVSATNSAGTTTESSTFTVRYEFGGWLPPITTSKFQRGRTLPVKFRINDAYGPTDLAVVEVFVDGASMGLAAVLYDDYGVPYYQLNVKLPDVGTSTEIKVTADDGVTSEVKVLTLK